MDSETPASCFISESVFISSKPINPGLISQSGPTPTVFVCTGCGATTITFFGRFSGLLTLIHVCVDASLVEGSCQQYMKDTLFSGDVSKSVCVMTLFILREVSTTASDVVLVVSNETIKPSSCCRATGCINSNLRCRLLTLSALCEFLTILFR